LLTFMPTRFMFLGTYERVWKVKKAFKLSKCLVCYCNIWQQSCEPEMNSYE
jgi:hypothetical protein